MQGCDRALSNSRVAGVSFMRADHIKKWLWGVKGEEDPELLSSEGEGGKW